jgi:hypothetical protein
VEGPAVSALDQPDVLASVPTLELLFTADSFSHIIERLVVHQAMASVLLGKSLR